MKHILIEPDDWKRMKNNVKAYIDLTRLHFFFVWPTLFCAGLFLAYNFYGSFSSITLLQVIIIGFLGFEAGLVLNDIVDANLDKKEIENDKLTKYWRPFGKRPISEGLISKQKSLVLFGVLVALTSFVIFTLSFPHSIYVFTIMVTCYCLEIFYQLKKRREKFPIAQIVGRIDFALFLVAGYLCVGNPDLNVLILFLFFYPLALAHLGVNDLIDVTNDKAKELNTIPTLYSMKATAYWIFAFTIFHAVMAAIFLTILNILAVVGFVISFILLAFGNYAILKQPSPASGMKALPMFHLAMLIYAITIITTSVFTVIF
jgi:4-hydroxybenzoate polyprenyltransferase